MKKSGFPFGKETKKEEKREKAMPKKAYRAMEKREGVHGKSMRKGARGG